MSKTPISHFPVRHAVAAVALSLSLGIVIMLPSKEASAVREKQTLAIPELSASASSETNLSEAYFAEEEELTTRTEKVKAGDNLSKIFQRAGLSDRDMFAVVHSSKAGKSLAKLYPGNKFKFEINSSGELEKLTLEKSLLESQVFTKTEKSYSHREIVLAPDVHLARRKGKIESSLYEAASAAHIDDSLIMELAGIFGWDIDFVLDIRSGDSFSILFEEKFLDGEKVGNGNILAAEFTNRGKTYKAVRYTDSKGESQYYAPNGDTMRKEFLRTPIDFARISSHFNLRRKHPVLNKIRAHKGTDYAAPRGTPIKAAGDGKVIYAGRKGGYGNTLIIKHGQTYKTLYAHINKFRKGVKVGKRVKQGQVVAYVGSTGLATGPHLHYEFYVNGSVRNPVTVKLPKAKAVPKKELERFLKASKPLLAKLEQTNQPTQMAAAELQDKKVNIKRL